MSAPTLPFELLLQIFRCLDARSFFAARRVCRWWHFAALEPVTLGRLLETLPISPSVSEVKLSPREAQRLARKAARTLMLEFHAYNEATDVDGPADRTANLPTQGLLTSTASEANNITATCDGQLITLLDTSAASPALLCQRRIDEKIGRGLWLQTWPLSKCNIALASRGHLLALSYNSSIQIYDFSSTPPSRCILNDSLTTTGDQRITGLEFEQRDHLLRVHLSDKGRVVYLGSPPETGGDKHTTGPASFEYWASDAGLQNQFLDSALLGPRVHGNGNNGSAWYSGLQLLKSPQENTHHFAAQRHGDGQSSRYTLLHATSTTTQQTSTPACRITPSSVVEIARLESFLSSLDHNVHRLLSHREIGLWENMPSAQESNPRFALTPDGEMLLLAEKERKRVSPRLSTQMFVYRLPRPEEVARMLEEEEGKAAMGRDATSWSPSASVLGEEGRGQSSGARGTGIERFTVPAVPLCLGTMSGDIMDVATEKVAGGVPAYRFVVRTDAAVRAWRLDSI